MSDGSGAPPRIRPGWVWAIFVLYVGGTAWGLIARVLMWLNLYPLSQDQLAIIRSQTMGSFLFNLVVGALSVVAATMLWLLRRQAVPLFFIVTALSIAGTVWQFFSGGPLDKMASQGTLMLVLTLFSILGGWLISLTICMYAWTLQQRGVLK